jgi:hypothetical protein
MQTPTYSFVLDCKDSELDYYLSLDPDKDFGVFNKFDTEWCLQAYLRLKQRNNLSLICTNKLQTGVINVVHSSQLMEVRGSSDNFIVCIQADFPHRLWAHYHIVQNQNQKYPNSSVVPLWIQPGLIKRDTTRKGVKKVAYAGQIYNGNLAGSKEMYTNLFAAHGIDFTTLPSGACADLSDVDVLIGIRSFDTNSYDKKPPSKLINAWHAEIPFIGGYDSAFRQVGVPGEDYLLAKSPDEILAAVLKLRDDESLYNKLVENGKKKAPQYTQENIAKEWETILTEPVLRRYQKWLSKPLLERMRFSGFLNLGLAEHQTKQTVKRILQMK